MPRRSSLIGWPSKRRKKQDADVIPNMEQLHALEFVGRQYPPVSQLSIGRMVINCIFCHALRFPVKETTAVITERLFCHLGIHSQMSSSHYSLAIMHRPVTSWSRLGSTIVPWPLLHLVQTLCRCLDVAHTHSKFMVRFIISRAACILQAQQHLHTASYTSWKLTRLLKPDFNIKRTASAERIQ